MSDKPKIKIGGIDVNVVTQTEAEHADVILCSGTSFFDDDVKSNCDYCGDNIVHRPNAPLSPPKCCINCFLKIQEITDELSKDEVSWQEASEEYLKRKNVS